MHTTTDNLSWTIFTAAPASGRFALDEIREADRGFRLLDWLEPGVGLGELAGGWDLLAAAFRRKPPVFVRHICPVQTSRPLARSPSDLSGLDQAVENLIPLLEWEQSFSVQTRLLGGGGWPYQRFDVNQRLAAKLQSAGVSLEVSRPQQVLSVVCTTTHAYVGLSAAADNLSDWAGGERRFKREAGQVSRAEFKLLEAIELFRVVFPGGGAALDLGAAPGGWTRLLRTHGMRVVAVDPAELHPSVASDPGVLHLRQSAQKYLPAGREFDIILNDMRLDALDSARLMLLAAGSLKRSGTALVTLKLPGRGTAQAAARSLDLLSQAYWITGARQLFHNRSEITVAMQRTGGR
jgi:23S rRNA (cytidine2498-2'-O)-methyltransferase